MTEMGASELYEFLSVVFQHLDLDFPRERPIVSEHKEGSICVVRACSNKWYQSFRSS